MKAVWRLLSAPLRRMPLGCTLALLIYLAGVAGLALLRHPAAFSGVVLGSWLWHLLAGMTLRSLLRPESLLLPGLRRHLAVAGGIDVALMAALPLALHVAFSGPAYAALIGAGLLLVVALGIASGLGLRALLLLWLVFVLAGWMPHLLEDVALALRDSAWTPLLLLLVGALVLELALRPLLSTRDRGDDESPMQALADGRRPAAGADGTPQARGPIGKRLSAAFDGTAQRALQHALARFHRRDSATTRMMVLRSVLLPHDNASAVMIRLLWVTAFAALYFFAFRSSRSWNAGAVGAYAVFLAVARFGAVGNGLVRLRPNLADLYLTLAPATRRDFQRMMADALLWLAGVALFNCAAYAVLVAALLHAHEPVRLVLAAVIAGGSGALVALAAHLVGPESKTGRGIVQMLVLGGAAAVYGLVYWLLGRFGTLVGGGIGAALTLPFGLGAWQAARREYLQRAPNFDAPIT